MTRIIRQKEILSFNPKLKRHVHHDSESRKYEFSTKGLSISNVTHVRHGAILDQGQVGSCTGNAAIGTLQCEPNFLSLPTSPKYLLSEAGALKLYSDAEIVDGDGPYPPHDNGSSGLSIAQVLLSAKLISGYQHTFTLDDALKAVSQYPIIVGINWYSTMFNPDPDGRVHPIGSIAGGHEILCRQIDATNQRIWFDNSWGTSWGVQGRFYLTFADFGTLLSQQGDVTVLLPLSSPAPVPTPISPIVPVPSSMDVALAATMKAWIKNKGL